MSVIAEYMSTHLILFDRSHPFPPKHGCIWFLYAVSICIGSLVNSKEWIRCNQLTLFCTTVAIYPCSPSGVSSSLCSFLIFPFRFVLLTIPPFYVHVSDDLLVPFLMTIFNNNLCHPGYSIGNFFLSFVVFSIWKH